MFIWLLIIVQPQRCNNGSELLLALVQVVLQLQVHSIPLIDDTVWVWSQVLRFTNSFPRWILQWLVERQEIHLVEKVGELLCCYISAWLHSPSTLLQDITADINSTICTVVGFFLLEFFENISGLKLPLLWRQWRTRSADSAYRDSVLFIVGRSDIMEHSLQQGDTRTACKSNPPLLFKDGIPPNVSLELKFESLCLHKHWVFLCRTKWRVVQMLVFPRIVPRAGPCLFHNRLQENVAALDAMTCSYSFDMDAHMNTWCCRVQTYGVDRKSVV